MPELNGVEEALRQTIQDLEARIQELQEQANSNKEDGLDALKAQVLETFGKALETLGISVTESLETDETEKKDEEVKEGEVAEESEAPEEGEGASAEQKESSGEEKFEEERQQLLQRISELEAENHQLRASVVADLRVRLGYVAEEKRDEELAKLVERTKDSLADTYADLMSELADRLSGERRHPGKVQNPSYSASGTKSVESFGGRKESAESKDADSPKGDREVIKSLLQGKLPW